MVQSCFTQQVGYKLTRCFNIQRTEKVNYMNSIVLGNTTSPVRENMGGWNSLKSAFVRLFMP